MRPFSAAAFLALLSFPAALAACGGSESAVPPPTILGISPPAFVGASSQPFTIDVLDPAPAPGNPCVVRFTATTGTPFLGGTSATAEVPGLMETVSTITGMSPPSNGTTTATVTLLFTWRPSAVSDGPIASFVENPPVASDDAYDAIGNVLFLHGFVGGLLANDSDPDGDPVLVSSVQNPSVNGGAVTVTSNGAFTYDPPTGFEGTDTFTYTVTDGALTATATVTMTVVDPVWFIDGSAAPGGDGRMSAPFDSVAAFMARQGMGAVADPDEGDVVFLYDAPAAYVGPLALLDEQRLVGQGVDLVVSGTLLVPAGDRPVLGSPSGTTLELSRTCSVEGLDVASASGAAISRSASLVGGTVTVDSVAVTATGGPALTSEGEAAVYDVTFDDVTATASNAGGIVVHGGTGTLDVTGVATISTSGGTLGAIDLVGSGVAATFASMDVDAALDAIDLDDFTGRFSVTGGSATAVRHVVRALNAHGPSGAPARIEVRGCTDLVAGSVAFRFGVSSGTFAAGARLDVLIVDDDLPTSAGKAIAFEGDLGSPVTYVARIADNHFPAAGDVDLTVAPGSALHATVVNNATSLGAFRNVAQGGILYLDVRENTFASYEVSTVLAPGQGTGVVIDTLPSGSVYASQVEAWIESQNTGPASVTDPSVFPATNFFNAKTLILVP